MKRFCSSLFAAATLCAILGLDGRLAAAEKVPFKGTLEGTFTATPVNPDQPLILNVHLIATGNATGIGAFTYDFPHVVDRTAVPPTGVGKSTFTAANGDKIFADMHGKATLIVPGLLLGIEKGTITGGSGRFANATGSYVIERLIDQIALTTIGSFEGTISSPGADSP
jgi:hypothetical protein